MNQKNLARADLNLLVVFDAVARTRSVTASAALLSLSQPAVSHALKRLRALMGDPLFVRGRDGFVLTPRAEHCIADIQAILGTVDRLLTSTHFDPTTTTQTFKFGASDYAMMTVIPAVVRALRAAAPNASLDVAHVDANLLPRLEKGEMDIAFVGASMSAGPVLSQVLFHEHFVGLVSQRHPIAIRAGQGTLKLKEYLAYPHVTVTFGNPRQSPIDVKLAELGKPRRVAMITPNFAANIASLHGTDLIMSLPSRLALIGQRQDLVRFKLPMAVPDYPYLMNWHQRMNDDPAIRWLRNVIIEATGAASVTKSARRTR